MTTLSDYKDKLHKLQQELQYIDQQRAARLEEGLKLMGAIEALEAQAKEAEAEAE